MDYVQSVLARQQRLLSLLLLGGWQETGEETEGRQAAHSSPQAQSTSAVSASQLFLKEDAKQSEETAEGNFWPGVSAARFRESLEHSAAARRQAMRQTLERRYGQMPESGTVHMTGGGISGDGSVQAAGAWSAAAAAGVGRKETQTAPAAAGGAWQEALSAQTVSLAFERDARRYDGGFSLY